MARSLKRVRMGPVAISALLLAALIVGGALLTAEGGGHHTSSTAKYGGLPSWLPTPKHQINQVEQASSTHPVLAIQGSEVSVALPHGRVLAAAVGPQVPEEGHFPVPSTSPTTFVVTFSAASGTVPISPSAFGLIDDLGHVRHPRVTTMDGGPAPRSVGAGRVVSLKLHDVIPTGDGGLTWAPDGGRPLVAWDFVVEID
jgi:hypothetical protein